MNRYELDILDALPLDDEITLEDIREACQEMVTQSVVRWLIRKKFGLRSDRDGWSNAKDLKAKDYLPGEAKETTDPSALPCEEE
jgi:hypothetical protein